jgi:hypothetical protein
MTPTAEIKRPPNQQQAATTPALRGPARSAQPPHSAAEEPRKMKNSVYIGVISTMRQSHVVMNSDEISEGSGQATYFWTPIARESGSQKTLKR